MQCGQWRIQSIRSQTLWALYCANAIYFHMLSFAEAETFDVDHATWYKYGILIFFYKSTPKLYIFRLRKSPNHTHSVHQPSILLQQLLHLSNLQLIRRTLEEPPSWRRCNLPNPTLRRGRPRSGSSRHQRTGGPRHGRRRTLTSAMMASQSLLHRDERSP